MAVQLARRSAHPPAPHPRPPRAARLAPVVAALWSLAYLGLGTAWLLGAGGNPADPAVDDAPAGVSLLTALGPQGGAALLAALGGLGVALSLVLARSRSGCGRGRGRLLTVLAGGLGLVLAVGIPDYRLLAAIAYTPILLVLRLTGDGADDVQVWPWPVVNLALLSVGGLAWLATAAVQRRRTAGTCSGCGRGNRRSSWTTPEAAARWGRWATAVAVLVPLGYATTRFAWALGIPLGVDQQFLDDMGANVYAGAGLAALAVGGAVLTLGLVQRWGEVFPRWMIGLRGRRVPIALAVVPAAAVSVVVGSAGLMFVRFVATGSFADTFPGGSDDIAVWLPELFWPVWAAALALAAYAYRLRRTPVCGACGTD